MATRDPRRQSDGWLSLEAGCDQGRAPNLLSRNQVAFAINTSFRGGYPTPRPGLRKCPLNFGGDSELEFAFKSSLFQTGGGYRADNRQASAISMQGGRVFRVNIADFAVQEITILGDPNPANLVEAWNCQAENFWLIQDDSSKVFCYNGGSARRLNERELPIGRQMTYYMGRVWIAKGRNYVGGDIVFGPSGTASLGFRDSMLKMTENQFLSGGGAFGVPMDAGDIVSLKPIANINTALGQGELIVAAENCLFATLVPQDRKTWQETAQPLQRVIGLENGARSQDGVVGVNEDLYFRSDDGIRSLAYQVRNSGQPGNTPISNEVQEILSFDSQDFLQFGSGVNFDNRLLMTCSPALSQNHGVYHRALVVCDFHLLSSMREKLPPAWEGIWTGLNILKIFKVRHNRTMRCFAYALSSNNEIELWEITRDALADDNGLEKFRIEWSYDSRSLDFGSKFDSNRLFSGDCFIDRVSGNVDIAVKYRPDGYPCWVDWDDWTECAKTELCVEDIVRCEALPNFKPQYRPNHQLVQPADVFDPITQKLQRVGFEFQMRFENKGFFRAKQFRANAYVEQEAPYGAQL